MSALDDEWDINFQRKQENRNKNIEYLESLSDKEKLDLLWKDFIIKHCDDYGFYKRV